MRLRDSAILLMGLLSVAATSLAGPYTYTYEGPAFNDFISGTWSGGGTPDHLSIAVTLDAPMVGPGVFQAGTNAMPPSPSPVLQAWTISDGLNTFDQSMANAQLFYMGLSLDAGGEFIAWNVSVEYTLPGGYKGRLQSLLQPGMGFVDLTFQEQTSALGTTGVRANILSAPGDWTLSSSSVPEPGGPVLALSGLALCFALRLQAKARNGM